MRLISTIAGAYLSQLDFLSSLLFYFFLSSLEVSLTGSGLRSLLSLNFPGNQGLCDSFC